MLFKRGGVYAARDVCAVIQHPRFNEPYIGRETFQFCWENWLTGYYQTTYNAAL